MRIAFKFCVFCVLCSAPVSSLSIARELFGADSVSSEAYRNDGTVHDDISDVPGVAIKNIPLIRSAQRRDRYFFIKSLASAVNYVNREILKQRVILEKKKNNVILSPQENAKLLLIYDFYKSRDVDDLLVRVAPIPVSLAVAQAALESRFGGNKHMSDRNAYFGLSRNGRRVLSFDTVTDSVIGYAKSLNVNGAYKKFRRQRVEMIATNQVLNGVKFIGTLKKYSANPAYGRLVARIIKDYKLEQLDRTVPYSLLQAAHKVVKKHGHFSSK